MKLLAVDTATDACSAALCVDERVLTEYRVAQRGHAQTLPGQVAGLLVQAGITATDLDGVICGIGPGSFAGLRIGMAYAKALAFVADCPMVGISSLQMLAEAVPEGPVLTVIDARLSAVYAAAWSRAADGTLRSVMPPLLCAPDALPAAPDGRPWLAVGSGFAVYAAELTAAWQAPLAGMDGEALPDACHALAPGRAALLRGEGVVASALGPLYLRDKVALTHAEQKALRAPR